MHPYEKPTDDHMDFDPDETTCNESVELEIYQETKRRAFASSLSCRYLVWFHNIRPSHVLLKAHSHINNHVGVTQTNAFARACILRYMHIQHPRSDVEFNPSNPIPCIFEHLSRCQLESLNEINVYMGIRGNMYLTISILCHHEHNYISNCYWQCARSGTEC
jgi:hypothetical protein